MKKISWNRKTGKPIIPERAKCFCGQKVKNHHWLCDKCYAKKNLINKKLKTALKLNNKEEIKKWRLENKKFEEKNRKDRKPKGLKVTE